MTSEALKVYRAKVPDADFIRDLRWGLTKCTCGMHHQCVRCERILELFRREK